MTMKRGRSILNQCSACGIEAFLVGGAVRDYVRGSISQDLDVAAAADEADLRRCFGRVVPVGRQHDTYLIFPFGEPVEVTRMRTGLKEDLKRRDFTINAMAMDREGTLIDPYSGSRHLQEGILASPVPETVFQEDPLRILRAVRMMTEFELEMEPVLYEAWNRDCRRTEEVPAERLVKEMDRWRKIRWHKASWKRAATLLLRCSLPIHPDPDQVQRFPQGEVPAAVWWALLLPEQALSMPGLAADVRRGAASIRRAVDRVPWSDWELYQLGQKRLEETLTCLWMCGSSIDVHYWMGKYHQLPIHETSDLQVNGRDFQHLSGRDIGTLLKKLEYDVVTGQRQNSREALMNAGRIYDD
ncbi:hypothetical protein [Alkalicoccus chagannorensis]|uniref:hypothetical protein n=1 Tax=Alkalicoccus chagannorensis TaxID=427072 RepID=UPI0003FD76F0|nr:hypothetical protein [Alkalicoccus chagannorensis]